MTKEFVIQLEGFKELDRALKKLPQRVATKALRSAGRRSGNYLRKAIRETIDQQNIRDSGQLRKEIKVRTKFRQGELTVTWHTGKAFYAHMVEFGTVKRKAQPFFRPTWVRERGVLIRKVLPREIWTSIRQETTKLRGASK